MVSCLRLLVSGKAGQRQRTEDSGAACGRAEQASGRKPAVAARTLAPRVVGAVVGEINRVNEINGAGGATGTALCAGVNP